MCDVLTVCASCWLPEVTAFEKLELTVGDDEDAGSRFSSKMPLERRRVAGCSDASLSQVSSVVCTDKSIRIVKSAVLNQDGTKEQD